MGRFLNPESTLKLIAEGTLGYTGPRLKRNRNIEIYEERVSIDALSVGWVASDPDSNRSISRFFNEEQAVVYLPVETAIPISSAWCELKATLAVVV